MPLSDSVPDPLLALTPAPVPKQLLIQEPAQESAQEPGQVSGNSALIAAQSESTAQAESMVVPDSTEPNLASDPTPDPAPDLESPVKDLPSELATFPAPRRLTHDERHKYLVTYDVREPKRLTRLHKRLKDWGTPVQFSVFEAILSGPETERMWDMVRKTIDETSDWVALYRLSRPFDEAVRHVGSYDPNLPANDLVIFI